jgi:hypothetical protein
MKNVIVKKQIHMQVIFIKFEKMFKNNQYEINFKF